MKHLLTILPVMTMLCMMSGCTKQYTAIGIDDAERMLKAGWTAYTRGNTGVAQKNFTDVIGGTASASAKENDGRRSAVRAGAFYGLGITYNFGEKLDREKARSYYEKAVREGGTNEMAAWASLSLARLFEVVPRGKKSDYAAARAAYQKIVDNYGGLVASEEAFFYLQATRIISYTVDDVRAAYSNVQNYIRVHPAMHDEYKEQLFALLSDACINISRASSFKLPSAERVELRNMAMVMYRERLKLLSAQKVNPVANDIAYTLWNMGMVSLYDLGDLATARACFTQLVETSRFDIRVANAKRELEKIERIERTRRVQ